MKQNLWTLSKSH